MHIINFEDFEQQKIREKSLILKNLVDKLVDKFVYQTLKFVYQKLETLIYQHSLVDKFVYQTLKFVYQTMILSTECYKL